MPVQALTVNEAAERLHVSRVSVYGLLKRGELQSFKIGRSRRISPDAIDVFIAARVAAETDAA